MMPPLLAATLAAATLALLPLAALAEAAAAAAEAEAEAEAAPTSLPAISVSTVGKRLMRDRVLASGFVGAVEKVQVQPLIEGQPIEALEADVGDKVAQGQVLARLSTTWMDLQKTQFEASLAAARATVAQAEAQTLEAQASDDEAQRVFTRTKALKERGNATQAAAEQAESAALSATARVLVARQSLEAARAQVALAEAQLANIELQRYRTEVKAPVSGEIVERNAQVGGIATAAGQPMFVIVKNSELELNAEVAEIDLMRLTPGQRALVRGVGSPAPLNGQIRLVEPSIDTATRLGRVRIWIEPGSRLVAGMFADAEILVTERETVAVPVTAVGSAGLETTVMRVTDGLVERVPVKTGIRDGGWVEVVEGLAPGETVVTKAGAFVRDGDRINPVADATN
jgi:HlyD family secretion protein